MTKRVLPLFFLSGFSGLVFEVVWLRLLALSFGATLPAVATVLSAFMAGLGVGAFLAGRYSLHCRRLFRAYCILEAFIGLVGLALTWGFFHLEGLARFLEWISGGAPALLLGLRVVILFFLLIVPTALMGATLPILTTAMIRFDARIIQVVSRLYGLNTAGAVLGCLLSDLLLIPRLGVFQSAATAAFLNFLVAFLGLKLVAVFDDQVRETEPGRETGTSQDPLPKNSDQPLDPSPVRGWAVLAGLTGAVGLALEVFLTRILLVMTGSRIYAFSAMLGVFLTGLAVGSLAISPWFDTKRRPQPSQTGTGLLLLATGIGVYLTLYISSNLDWISSVLSGLSHGLDWGRMTMVQVLLISMMVMAVPTLGLGALFPVIVRQFQSRENSGGAAVGIIYFWNTMGCIIGSLTAGFLLLPTIGVQKGLALIGLLLIISGLYIVWHPNGPKDRFRWIRVTVTTAAAAAAVGCVLLLPSGYLYQKIYLTRFSKPNNRILHFQEGMNETIIILDEYDLDRPVNRRLITNSTAMSATNFPAQRYMRLMAHLPVLFNQDPKSALLICYGVGNTLAGLVSHPGLQRIQVVDISADILDLSRFFKDTNQAALEDVRVSARVADGRHFLVTTDQKFDLITSEPPPPAARGVVNLYSKEYYLLARKRLNPGGLVCQWLPIYQIPTFELQTLIRAFLDVFPHAALFNGIGGELLLLGGPEPLQIAWGQLVDRVQTPSVSRELESIGIESVYDFLATMSMSRDELETFTKNLPPCTDNHPYIEYADFGRLDPDAIQQMARLQGDPQELISDWNSKEIPDSSRRKLAEALALAFLQKKMAMRAVLADNGHLTTYRWVPIDPPIFRRLPDNRYTRYLVDIERETLDAARTVLERNPGNDRALGVLAANAFHHSRFEEAKNYLEELMKLPGSHKSARLYLDLTYRYLGLKDQPDLLVKEIDLNG